ncbi:UNVERIFIED_CONTAM: hypothetical protein ABID98_004656 [Brevibacillus sp. OAP136]
MARKRKISPVQIYGQHKNKKVPIETDQKGRLCVNSDVKVDVQVNHGFTFCQKKWRAETRDVFLPVPTIDISHAYRYVFAVSNVGDADAEVQVQVGPSRQALMNDEIPYRIPAHQTVILTPLRFSRLIRVQFRSVQPEQPTCLIIYFQAQMFQ